ncbi:MAG: acetyl-CoA C-acyltransferase [Thermoanaerobaculia bacterium]|nr:acetyl-CoA C-acyltransferase [Thermoanaerobaculia bacterium]
MNAPEEPIEAAAVREEIGARADSVRAGGVALGFPAVARVTRQTLRGRRGRVAIVAAARTPFARSGGALKALDGIDLAGIAAAEAVARAGIDPGEIDASIFGIVVPPLHGPNLGREVVFRAGLPASIPGFAVNLACASSNRAIVSGAEAILAGEADLVVAGGAESLSNVPITFSRGAGEKFQRLAKAKRTAERLRVAASFRPRDFAPVAPAIAEFSTGLTMGEACEKMAKENGVSRAAQDEIALLSHRRAAAAAAAGRFARQLSPVFPPPGFDRPLLADDGVRADASFAALSALRPVFDRRHGTLTAGNSSPITDGGAAVVLASEERARTLGRAPLGYVRSWAWFAVPPGGQLLQGPAYAAPLALERAGLTLADIDLVEMHEAFAAQVVSNLKAFASAKFAAAELGRAAPLGEVDLERWNVDGGSIALGHPFGATGARLTMQLLEALGRRGLNLGLITVCAAGGHGFAMVVERE